MDRPVVVAIAAPFNYPFSGIGPKPNIKIGSKIIFSPLAIHNARIAMEASPAPRKIALIKKSRIILILPANIIFGVSNPFCDQVLLATHQN